jgi:CDP-paratose 2-epimerase
MKLLITGICGFVGQTLARTLLEHVPRLELTGLDNLIRPGSELNRRQLDPLGVKFFHGDVRNASDLEALPPCDWVVDAAANSSVLAGLEHPAASRQLVEHNLSGTINLLEHCRRHRAGLILLSTSRVYSIASLTGLALQVYAKAFRPVAEQPWPPGCSAAGVEETFSTQPPISLYGSTKLASELLALEYGAAFGVPIWINRCGVLACAGQFGRPDQGIFSYWLHAYAARRPLKYTGFDGKGFQVRDALHPADLVPVLVRQFREPAARPEPPLNFGGGASNSVSLAQLSDWCADRFGQHWVESDPVQRPYDIPWLVMDCAAAAGRWGWQPQRDLNSILEEIAGYADRHPYWLDLTSA